MFYIANKPHQLYSDIHQNFVLSMRDKTKVKHLITENIQAQLWYPVTTAEDRETVLLLAGDIWESFKSLSFSNFSYLKSLSERYLAIVVVLGNHDYYRENVTYFATKFQKRCVEAELSNVHILQNSSVVINDILYVGGTLWFYPTSDEINQYLSQVLAKGGSRLTDFYQIRVGSNYRKFRIADGMNEFNKTVNYLTETVKNSDYPVVVLTHHSPIKASLMYKDDVLNPFYATDLTRLMQSKEFQEKVRFWGFGHIHQRFEEKVGNIIVKNHVVMDHAYHYSKE